MKKNLLFGAMLAGGLLWGGSAEPQAILPNGQTQIADSNGAPLAGGQVFFYVPGTTTPKQTYQDPGLTTPNTNPVVLNAAGRMIAWGAAGQQFREVVYDQFGVLIWDQITSTPAGAGAGGSAPLGGFGPVGTIASNSTTDIGTIASHNVEVTGANGIASLGSSASLAAPYYFVKFDAALVLTYNVTSMTLPGQQNIKTLAGDTSTWMYLGSGNWQLVQLQHSNGTSISTTGQQVSLAGGTTTDLGSTQTNVVSVTGSATITSFGSSASVANPIYQLTFTGASVLTYNATSLILPGAANITTSAGSYAVAEYLGSGNWQVLTYSGTSGSAGFQVYRSATAGADTFTFNSSTTTSRVFKITAIGGGAGGGATSTISSGAGGGGSGGQAIYEVSGFKPGDVLTLSIGSKGAGAPNSGVAGSAGTDTTVIYNAQTLIDAGGGLGGGSSTTGPGTGGAGGPLTTNFTGLTAKVIYNSGVQGGGDGYGAGGGYGGAGGGNWLGQGGPAAVCPNGGAASNGRNALGFGSGGSGGCTNTSGASVGGTGQDGVFFIEWVQ